MKGKAVHACLWAPQHLPELWFYASLSFDFFLNEKLISVVVPAWELVNMQQRCCLPPPPAFAVPSHPLPEVQSNLSDTNTREQSCLANSGNYQEAWSCAEIMSLK